MVLFEEYLFSLTCPLTPLFPTQIDELKELVYYGLLDLAEKTSSTELLSASADIIAFEKQLADVRTYVSPNVLYVLTYIIVLG